MPNIAHEHRLKPVILKEIKALKSGDYYASHGNRICGYVIESNEKKPLPETVIKELEAVFDLTGPDELGFWTISGKKEKKEKSIKDKEKDK